MDNLEVYVNISVAEFPLICRICLTKGKLGPFEESLVTIFYNLTDIQVESEDNLPSKICHDCTTKLEDISKFIDLSKLNDVGLRRILQVKNQPSEQCEESTNNDVFGKDLHFSDRSLKSEDEHADFEENEVDESDLLNELSDKVESKKHGNKKESSTSDSKKFYCFHCNKTFPTKNKLKVHLLAHSEEGQFQCKLCEKKFKFSQNLVRHNNSVHKELKPFKCEICQKDIDTDPEEHMEMHSAKNIKAGEMEFDVTYPTNELLPKLDVSKNRFYLSSQSDSESYSDELEQPPKKNYCAQCDRSFTLCFHYNIHMRKHKEKMMNGKKSCEKLPTETSLSKNVSGDDAGDFTCEICGKPYKKKKSLDCHSKIHLDKRLFECRECGMSFQLRSYYNRHVKTHQAEKNFLCWVCGKKFKRPRLLNIHMRIHNGEKPFGCNLCGKRFTQGSTLRFHLKYHTGERKFQCSICDQAFLQHRHLLDHVKLKHTDEKGHECKYCKKAFTLKSSLNRHILIHNGVKPHVCTDCGMGFREKRQLRSHAKRCAQ